MYVFFLFDLLHVPLLEVILYALIHNVCMCVCMYVCMYIYMYVFYLYIVYSQHAPLLSVILHALPDHLHTVLLVSYRIYIIYGSAVRM